MKGNTCCLLASGSPGGEVSPIGWGSICTWEFEEDGAAAEFGAGEHAGLALCAAVGGAAAASGSDMAASRAAAASRLPPRTGGGRGFRARTGTSPMPGITPISLRRLGGIQARVSVYRPRQLSVSTLLSALSLANSRSVLMILQLLGIGIWMHFLLTGSWEHTVIILELTKAILNTMYMRLRKNPRNA